MVELSELNQGEQRVMNYTGIDWHKKYSVCYTVDRQGSLH
jgi:hypothetical protein